jgi:hypothetical protein
MTRDLGLSRGQKSAESTRSTSLPVALSKAEFVERAAKWGAARDFKFTTSLLNRWINEGLLAEGDRGGNVGKHPVYRYSCRHYRRVLQVLRLYARGLNSRDAILIALFLNGHGVKPFEVREPIAREFARARTKLNALMRSSRFDEEGPVPPKHKESLVRSLGPGDERFVKAGVILPPDQMVEAARAARSPDPESKLRTIMNSGAEDWRLQLLKPALGGILSEDPEIPAEIDQIIANATDADLTLSASILNLFRAVLSWLESKNRSPEIAGLLSGLLASFSQPEFIAAHFALQLTLLKRFPVDKGELEEFLLFANGYFS